MQRVILIPLFTAVTCPSGHYSGVGATACTPCPGGYQCADKMTPTLCVAGTYASNSSDSCTSCEAGYYCPTDGMTEPFACPAGHYQTSTGATSCTECPQGEPLATSSQCLLDAVVWGICDSEDGFLC